MDRKSNYCGSFLPIKSWQNNQKLPIAHYSATQFSPISFPLLVNRCAMDPLGIHFCWNFVQFVNPKISNGKGDLTIFHLCLQRVNPQKSMLCFIINSVRACWNAKIRIYWNVIWTAVLTLKLSQGASKLMTLSKYL